MAYNNFAGPRQTSQVWFPVSSSLLPPIASTDSQESFASQVPLPYHLPAAQSQEEIYGQPYGQNMYGGPSPREGFPYQPTATFNPSSMSPYLQGEYNSQGPQQLSGPPPQQIGYGGNFDPYNQEQPTQDGYGGQYRSGYPRPQPVYAGNPYPPPANYQSPSTSWSMGYPPQSNDGQNIQASYGRSDEQTVESNYYQGQGSNAAYGSSGGSSTNQQGNSQSHNQEGKGHRRPFSGSWRNIRSEDSQNNQEQGDSSNSATAPVWRLRGPSGEDRSRESSQIDSKSNTSGSAKGQIEHTPCRPAAGTIGSGRQQQPRGPPVQAESIGQKTFTISLKNGTPVGKTGTDSAIKQTPTSAAHALTGSPTPVLRRRHGLDVSDVKKTFKIDPLKGPPPAFWPGKFGIGASDSNQLSNVEKSKEDEDPFATNSNASIAARVRAYSAARENKAANAVNSAFGALGPVGATAPIVSSGPMIPFPINPSRALAPLIIPGQQPMGPSMHLASICPQGSKPDIDFALNPFNLPFCEPARDHLCQSYTGLVKISNIPYSVTRQEIMAFLGRNAKLIPEAEEPIHIIMERTTSKTMDAYIEFVDVNEAVNAVNRYETNRSSGHGGRLGERHVELTVAGHPMLLKDLFPRAKNVVWNGADPEVMPVSLADRYNSGFAGFIAQEELVMMVKHVETPQRSPFSRECPQRPFECLISTLIKYPWHRVDLVTVGERDKIFQAAQTLVCLLLQRLAEGVENVSVDNRLLRRVQRAIFNCKGFTEFQKDSMACILNVNPMEVGLPPYSEHWGVFRALGAKRGWASDVTQYYIALIRESTTSAAITSLAAQAAAGLHNQPQSAFGALKIVYPADVNIMSLQHTAQIEWDIIEDSLRKVLSAT